MGYQDLTMRNLISALAAAVLIASSGPALAQERDAGYVTAFACGSYSKAAPVTLYALDDSKDYRAVFDRLRGELKSRGVTEQEGAPIRVQLDIQATRQAARRKGRDLGRISRGNAYNEKTQVDVNLWSNKKDSVLGGRRDEVLQQAEDRIRVQILVTDHRNGRCQWQGEAVHDLAGRDTVRTARALLPYLLDHLGQSVRQERIVVD